MTRLTELDDNALFVLVQKGDPAAFSVLYERYHGAIYHFVLKFVKVSGMAEDLTHDVFLRLWQVRERIAIKHSFEAYLYRIARNITYRKMTAIIADRKMQEEIASLMPATDSSDAAGQLYDKEYQHLLSAAMGNLSPQRRKVFQLCRIEGKTYTEASAILGISRNTIKEHMTEAMRFVKHYFMEKGDIVLVLLLLGY